jgi:hypothetical protein
VLASLGLFNSLGDVTVDQLYLNTFGCKIYKQTNASHEQVAAEDGEKHSDGTGEGGDDEKCLFCKA